MPNIPPDLDTGTATLGSLTRQQLVDMQANAKTQRDALPYGDVRWYDLQYQVYQLSQEILVYDRRQRR